MLRIVKQDYNNKGGIRMNENVVKIDYNLTDEEIRRINDAANKVDEAFNNLVSKINQHADVLQGVNFFDQLRANLQSYHSSIMEGTIVDIRKNAQNLNIISEGAQAFSNNTGDVAFNG